MLSSPSGENFVFWKVGKTGLDYEEYYNTELKYQSYLNDMHNFAASAQMYYMKPKELGGGGQSFDGWIVPRLIAFGATYGQTISKDGQSVTINAYIVDDKTLSLLVTPKSSELLNEGKKAVPSGSRRTENTESNVADIQTLRDNMYADLNNLIVNAYHYRIRPSSMGGGQGSYLEYRIPRTLSETDYASFTSEARENTITFTAKSKAGLGTIAGTASPDGRLQGPWRTTGNLAESTPLGPPGKGADLPKELDPPQQHEQEEIYFVAVEEMPEPIGGIAGIQSLVVYPESAGRAGAEGTVYVGAFVDETGNVTRTQIMKGISAPYDEAAVAAVMKTKFKPGKHHGKAVKVKTSIPIRFRLQK